MRRPHELIILACALALSMWSPAHAERPTLNKLNAELNQLQLMPFTAHVALLEVSLRDFLDSSLLTLVAELQLTLFALLECLGAVEELLAVKASCLVQF